VFGQASGFAFYPYLTKLARKKSSGRWRIAQHDIAQHRDLLLPLSAILALLSRQVISLLYGGGRFDAQSTTETASIFYRVSCRQLCLQRRANIARSFYAQQKMVFNDGCKHHRLALTIPLYLFFQLILGGTGIALAAVVGMTLQCACSIRCVLHAAGFFWQ
jgi:putative peptidoglycan lipid II flippase